MRICDSSIRVRMDSETKQKASAALEEAFKELGI